MLKRILPKFIFFDLDDTLLDDEVSTQVGVSKLFEKYSPQVTDCHQRWADALDEYYPAFLSGDINVRQLQMARIRYVLPEQTFSDEEALAAFEYFMVNYVEGATLFDESKSVIATLKQKGIGLGVISNGPDDMQVRKLKAVGLYDQFDVVVTAERAGIGKPNVAIFDFAVAEAGMTVKDCWCVGDNINNDVLAANEAGLTGLLLDRSGKHSDYRGDKISELSEICEL